MESAHPVVIEHVRVERGRLSLRVRLDSRFPVQTDAFLAQMAVRLHPALPYHACINGRGPTFASVVADTSLPHLFEHLIIDAQTADPHTPADARFVGTTRWINKASGIAQIEVSFIDDLVALQAIRDAQAALSDILEQYESHRRTAGKGAPGA